MATNVLPSPVRISAILPKCKAIPPSSAPRLSHPAALPVRAIDYCVASPGLPVTARVLDAPGSDHLPVLAEISGPLA